MKARQVKSEICLSIDTEAKTASYRALSPDVPLSQNEPYSGTTFPETIVQYLISDDDDFALAGLTLYSSNLEYLSKFVKFVNKGRKKWGSSKTDKAPVHTLPLQFTQPGHVSLDLPYRNDKGNWHVVFMPCTR